MARTGSALCVAVMTPVEGERGLPPSKDTLIAGIRSILSEKQGLIQAEVSENRAFSILKELKESGGVQYLLAYQRVYPEFMLTIQARFEEIGLTGGAIPWCMDCAASRTLSETGMIHMKDG